MPWPVGRKLNFLKQSLVSRVKYYSKDKVMLGKMGKILQPERKFCFQSFKSNEAFMTIFMFTVCFIFL